MKKLMIGTAIATLALAPVASASVSSTKYVGHSASGYSDHGSP